VNNVIDVPTDMNIIIDIFELYLLYMKNVKTYVIQYDFELSFEYIQNMRKHTLLLKYVRIR
jgi:hypothetical protein